MNNKTIAFIGVVVLLVGFYIFDSRPTTEESLMETNEISTGFNGLISAAEFADKLSSEEYVVLDVRTISEYQDSRITPDALLVDFYAVDFKTQLEALDKNKKYLMHCRSGSRSAAASKIMQELGFKDFYELDGGINEWSKAGYQTVSG